MPVERVALDLSVEGKNLCSVTFTPPSENPAQQFSVEVVFEWKRIEVVTGRDPVAIYLLSSTRTDTREAYSLGEAQRDALAETALETIAEEWT